MRKKVTFLFLLCTITITAQNNNYPSELIQRINKHYKASLLSNDQTLKVIALWQSNDSVESTLNFGSEEALLKQKELDQLINIIGEEIYRHYTNQNNSDAINTLATKTYSWTHKKYAAIDSVELYNYCYKYACNYKYTIQRYYHQANLRAKAQKKADDWLYKQLKPYEVSQWFVDIVSKRFGSNALKATQYKKAYSTYNTLLEQDMVTSNAIDSAVYTFTTEQKQDLEQIMAAARAQSYIDKRNLPETCKPHLTQLYQQYNELLLTANDDFNKKEYYNKLFRVKRTKIIMDYALQSINKQDYSVAKHTLIMKHEKKLNLSQAQKTNWLSYYVNYIDTCKATTEHGLFDDDYAIFLSEEQYTKLLNLRATPYAKQRTNQIITKLTKANIEFNDSDKNEVLNYYRALRMAQLRYKNDNDKRKYVVDNINHSRSQRTRFLLSNANQHGKQNKQYQGTYQW